MAKQKQQQQHQREQKGGGKMKMAVGKGKVTAVQVAFMVERYLADNHYTNALSAFRSDAAHLFAKMKTDHSQMKGLLGLGEILDDYIALKEQKLRLHHDRMRLDSAMLAFNNLFRSYYSCSSDASPSTDLINPFVTPTNVPAPAPPTTTTTATVTTKRKLASISDIPSSKRPCTVVPSSSNPSPAPMQVTAPSPHTPQPTKLLITPLGNGNQPNSSTCSVVSSERIIVSPLKGGGSTASYYSVERRSYQFTSPSKTDGVRNSGKRDHVKGKLNFDNVDPAEAAVNAPKASSSSSPATSSPSSSDGTENENQVTDGFDFDFSEFDILNGDFSFSELLLDLDLESDGPHSQSSPEQTTPDAR